MSIPLTHELVRSVEALRREATSILASHESATVARVITLNDTYAKLTYLNLKQDDLMRQALRCAEFALFRAAHVMAWAAVMDLILEKLASDGLAKLRAERPQWKGADISEMAEYVPERQFIDVLQELGLASKNEVKGLGSLLDRRNECAHPTDYYPDVNATLGYISEILARASRLAGRSL